MVITPPARERRPAWIMERPPEALADSVELLKMTDIWKPIGQASCPAVNKEWLISDR